MNDIMLHLVEVQINVIVITDQAGEVCVCVCVRMHGVCVKARVYVCKLPSLCTYFYLCMFSLTGAFRYAVQHLRSYLPPRRPAGTCTI